MDSALCVGIDIQQDDVKIDVRREGRQLARLAFRNDQAGLAALSEFISAWQGPVRLAIAAIGSTAIAVGLVLGAAPGRQVYLVARAQAAEPAALSRYAEQVI
ncbi:hypothetical protein D0B54_12845 [Solimonas sp. K1W22B-7]|uniref:hypothetical protein n=1 Tax=Solimonas sp. K1W22B-7 TaxID=2303331 RepID=UPI000E333F7F|nr:hypothetical protein [Solimonas sp. K1W22B-7]AXQ29526.1 hypothetical protein D0B54_12845 [Solimonas sp. K1W22B-7]